MLLSLHKAYITNYDAYGVIYHLMDLSAQPSLSLSEVAHESLVDLL